MSFTNLVNKKTQQMRSVSYTRQYICVDRVNGPKYYTYTAKRVYKLMAIAKSSK